MSECEGGVPPASPIAVPIRASSSHQKVVARPHNIVMTVHSGDAQRQHVATAGAIGPRGDRDAEGRVEERERDAAQQAQQRVAGAELVLDRLDEDAQNRAVR